MELVKERWTKSDILDFKNYEKTLVGSEKDTYFEQKIVNTKLKCFGRTSTKAREIAKQIKKGNYQEFLDSNSIDNHLDSLIAAHLISSIKDYDIFEKYIKSFVLTIDNWASVDTLKFKKVDKNKLAALSKKFLKSDKTYVRRTGVGMWFELIKDEKYFDGAFDVLNGLKNETEYYVNMCGAWLLAECFAKNRDKTLGYFKNNCTNDFVVNKAIAKCRDSFRVSKEDKDYLLNFKRK